MAEVISFEGDISNGVTIRNYREVTRKHLLKVISDQEKNANSYLSSNYDKN